MIVAEITITEGGFGEGISNHRVGFNDLEKARSEYTRIGDLLNKRSERKNDLPALVELDGGVTNLSIPLTHIRSLGLADFAKANAEMAGVRDTYPNLFKS